jgi:hypothetical protein
VSERQTPNCLTIKNIVLDFATIALFEKLDVCKINISVVGADFAY